MTLVTELGRQLKQLDISGCTKLSRSEQEMLQDSLKSAKNLNIVYTHGSKVSETMMNGVLVKCVRFNDDSQFVVV